MTAAALAIAIAGFVIMVVLAFISEGIRAEMRSLVFKWAKANVEAQAARMEPEEAAFFLAEVLAELADYKRDKRWIIAASKAINYAPARTLTSDWLSDFKARFGDIAQVLDASDGTLDKQIELEIEAHLGVITAMLHSPAPDTKTIASSIGRIVTKLHGAGVESPEAAREAVVRIGAEPPEVADAVAEALGRLTAEISRLE